jgi:hypothetical protein
VGITLTQIASNTARVTFSYMNESVTLEYYPGKVTERVIARLMSFSNMNEESLMADLKLFNEMLAGLIKSWDVFEDEAQTKMFPLDAERLAELPFMFRVRLVQVIIGDMRPEVVTPQTPS